VHPGDLAIDYGTSNTVALVRTLDGRTRQLLFDGSPLSPSAVYADPDGPLRAGRDAVRAARLDPSRYEPNPKRRIDEIEVLLGDRTFAVADLIAATLRRVRDEALRTTGQPPGRVVLTHPAAWGSARRATLLEACARAGLPAPLLVDEPTAAATYFAAHARVTPGQAVVVYDLGAGTFDVSVVRHTGAGFETLGYRGLDDIGGLDFDALLVAHAGRQLGPANAAVWQRILHPRDTADRRNNRLLWDDAREAKETLSRQQSVTFAVPVVGGDAMVTRAEFDALAGPLLTRTVDVTVATIQATGVRPEALAGVFLVGGGSRIPLVATLLHQRSGIAPTALEQPELVVAEGALAAAGGSRPAGGPGPAGRPAGAPPQRFAAPAQVPAPGRVQASAPVAPTAPARPTSPASPASPVSGGGQFTLPPASGRLVGGMPVSGAPMGGSPVSGGRPVSGPPVGGGRPPAFPPPAFPPPAVSSPAFPPPAPAHQTWPPPEPDAWPATSASDAWPGAPGALPQPSGPAPRPALGARLIWFAPGSTLLVIGFVLIGMDVATLAYVYWGLAAASVGFLGAAVDHVRRADTRWWAKILVTAVVGLATIQAISAMRSVALSYLLLALVVAIGPTTYYLVTRRRT
jgi:hypothetical protein